MANLQTKFDMTHRLFSPLEKMLREKASVIIVVAGMEGALPKVVKGLVDVPVIGVPTSIGYGYGGKGESALMTMLQSCSLGLVVVNIDNGFRAGSAAVLIAQQSIQNNEGKGGSPEIQASLQNYSNFLFFIDVMFYSLAFN